MEQEAKAWEEKEVGFRRKAPNTMSVYFAVANSQGGRGIAHRFAAIAHKMKKNCSIACSDFMEQNFLHSLTKI
jgi:hypothetical protein